MTKKRLIPVIGILSVLLAAALCLGFTAMLAHAETELNTQVTFAQEYAVGSTVAVPDAQIVHEGQALATQKRVVCPDGSTVSSDSITVDKKGAYTVTYSAVAGGSTLTKTFAFEGYYPLYSMGKSASTAYYGASDKYGGIQGRDGVVVSLAPGDTFEWGEIIDLNGKTATDALLSMYVTPNTLGTADANKILFTLTDIYDEENYVTVTLKKVEPVVPGAQWAEINSYVTAGANDQLQMGLTDTTSSDPVVYVGVTYGRAVGTKMGSALSGFSLPGTPKYVQNDADSVSEQHFLQNPQTFSFSFHYEKYVVYVNSGNGNVIVADLDAEECFDNLWRGFTTGEVYLRISGQEYLSTSLNFVLTEVNGVSVADTAKYGNRVIDDVPPVLHVELPDEIPQALVDVPYTLFPATATDVYDGNITPVVTVKAGMRNIKVTDGCFTPTVAATYTVTYTATDYSGNPATQTITITAKVGDTLSAQLTQADDADFVTGRAVTVRGFLTQNASGKVHAQITATRIADPHGNALQDGVRYTVADGSFVPMYGGTYRIDYQIEDYLSSRQLSYTQYVAINDGIEILEVSVLPRYYISGMLYSVPQAKAYRFDENGATEVPVTLSWAGDGNQMYTQTKSDIFAPVATRNVTLRFVAAYNGKSAKIERDIPAADVGYNDARLYLENYFVPVVGDVTATAHTDRIELSAPADGQAAFANALQTAEFALRFSSQNANAVTLLLTDTADKENTLSLRYSDAANGKINVTVRTSKGEIVTQVNYAAGDTLEPTYKNASRTVFVTEKSSFDISRIFDGFSGNVWLDIAWEGEGSVVRLYELNGQGLTNVATDRIRPMILVDVESGERAIGDTYTVNPCTVADVLDPYVTAYMYMTAPDGSIVTAVDGTVLDASADITKRYEVALTMLGEYTVNYYAKDTAQNVQMFSFRIKVADSTPPVIVCDTADYGMKAGGTIALPTYTVTDDTTAADNIVTYTYIILPNSSAQAFDAPLANVQAGIYKVVCYAYDEQGNCAVHSYTVTVGV